MSWLAYLGGGILVAGILSVVVYYIRRAVLNVARVDSLQAATELQKERIRVQEEAEREARVKARKEIDAKTAEVHDSATAAELLREAFDDDPETN